jgi:hypothetical protein
LAITVLQPRGHHFSRLGVALRNHLKRGVEIACDNHLGPPFPERLSSHEKLTPGEARPLFLSWLAFDPASER